MIAGQSPRLQWQPNPGGQIRTVEEAIAVLARYFPDVGPGLFAGCHADYVTYVT